uniref:Family with sequence similarity 219 member B n=1 Tax=Canis lupus dingo TaxID=286419 RepID=A0A8C0JTN8_CANLU
MVTRAPSLPAKLRECGRAGAGAGAGGGPGGGGPRAAAREDPLTRALCLAAKPRDLARAVLRRKGVQGAPPPRPGSSAKRSVKFNKGYTALSQSPDENLVSLDSDSDGELESRYSSGYSSAEASPERLSARGQAAGSVTATAKCLSCACCIHGTMPDFRSVLQSSTLPYSPNRGIGV